MTATTAQRAYPYPEGSDFLGDTAAAVQALADAVDADVDGIDARVDAIEAATPDARLDAIEGTTPPVANGVLARLNITADHTGIAAETTITGSQIDVTVPAGRWLRIDVICRVDCSAAGAVARLRIMDGGTTLQFVDTYLAAAAIGPTIVGFALVDSGAGGAKVYTLRLERVLGSGNLAFRGAGAGNPAQFTVTDLGPSA